MNLDFIKQKLDTLQGKNKLSSKFWKPTDGEHTVRILPYKYNRENPFVELKFYYYRQANGKTLTYLSPSINGNPDPVLEFCENLRSDGTKESWILSKSYEPKLRTYVPIVVRGKEDEGVKFWGFGKQVYEQILEEMANPDIGDITDLEQGNDLIVKFTKNPPSGKKFPETKVKARVKKTVAVDPTNQDLLNKIQDQVDILTLFTEPAYDELDKEFKNHLNPETEPAPDAEGAPDDTAASNDATASTPATPPTATEPSSPSQPAATAADKATVSLSPDEMKAKFKKMFADAAASK